jgi:tetratricopeptide (TPR) repeat protein
MIIRNNILSLLLQLIILFSCSFVATAQSSLDKKKIFAEAESHRLFNEYEKAKPLYLQLEKPDNYNIKYKIGTCYLNILGEKAKAIPYLESAVKHSSYNSKTTAFREKKAPLDSYFYLGRAYMINNELENALNTFQIFKKIATDVGGKEGMENFTYVDQQILACINGMNKMPSPFSLSKNRLGSGFSKETVNENPAVSFDGKTIVYTEHRGVINAIMFSKKIRGKWKTPVEITSQLKAGDDCSSCSLNNDGTMLYLYKTDNFDGNIYSSQYVDGGWTPITKLNNNINTGFYESHAAISSDNKKLYFTSNRDGGHGGLDIYVSVKDASGDWGPAINLGNTINTSYNEDTPFITLNDSLLYFSSEGHNGMGGYDIFRSSGSGEEWKDPQNLGYPVNSTDDDRFFQPFNNDENGYYSIATDYKVKEIFYLTLTVPRLNRVFELSGNYSLKDTIVQYTESNSIYLINKSSGDTLDIGYPDKHTGHYNFIVAPGNFRLIYTGPGYYPQIIDTSVVLDQPSRVIELKEIILDKNFPGGKPVIYKKLDLSNIPVAKLDSSILIKNLQVKDVTENDMLDTTILYYTVQVMALYNPVDISYFRYVSDIKVLYNQSDLFYRYTTGIFKIKDEAYAHKNDLISKGYPDDLFIKKVTRMSGEKPVTSHIYYSIQLKATRIPVDMNIVFAGLNGVRETKEVDGMYHYLYGRYTSATEAYTVMKRKQIMEFSDAFVREIQVLNRK